MNVNPIFVNFQNVIGHPVDQDAYEGTENIYFVFSYEDETGTLYGDDKPLEDTCSIQLKLYTPKNFDYMDLKKRTVAFFEERGFIFTGKRSWLENVINNETQKIRCNLFEMDYTTEH